MRLDGMGIGGADPGADLSAPSGKIGSLAAPLDTTVMREWSAQPLRHAAAKAEATPPNATVVGAVSTLREAKLEAALSADVYSDKPHPPAGWRVASEGDLQKLKIGSGDLEDPKAHFRARVYLTSDHSHTRYVIAFRGSQSSGDWENNVEQGLRLHSASYTDALVLGRKLAADQHDIDLTGHSLGGGLASAAAIASGNMRTPSTRQA